MASLNKFILQILLATIMLAIAMLSNGKAQIIPHKVTVQIINDLSQPQDLTLHCKDKHHDLGVHTLRVGEMFDFRFRPNMFEKFTLYYCGFRWPSSPLLHRFDIYDQARDSCKMCTWKITEKGACTYDGSFTHCYLWNSKPHSFDHHHGATSHL
ncbi:S-protein-like protein 5-like [Senna tora]|uniref:S-protein homolog n=1 Tax=Senna tora TaxID=362788 RepID=A0A834WBH1_9FABA|nr:S-protein-like protein 5-like [Senna tora]